jgi:hypothetical protein
MGAQVPVCSDIYGVKAALVAVTNSNGNEPDVAVYCANLYLSTTDSILSYINQNRFEDSFFIKKLATDFGNEFFEAYNLNNDKNKLPRAWKLAYHPTSDAISDFQLLLLGINAHINCDLYDALLVNYLPSKKKKIAHDFFLIDKIFLDVTQSIVTNILTIPRLTEPEKKVLLQTIKRYERVGTYCRKLAYNSVEKSYNGNPARVKRIVKRKDKRANKLASFIVHPRGKFKKSIAIISKYESTKTNENLKLFFP